jgi:nicotinamide mononucleotide (NMN) deamidase PncC
MHRRFTHRRPGKPPPGSAAVASSARGVVSAAEEMVRGVAMLLDAEVAVATTGVAGDHSEDGSPPGTVYIATYVDGQVATLDRSA